MRPAGKGKAGVASDATKAIKNWDKGIIALRKRLRELDESDPCVKAMVFTSFYWHICMDRDDFKPHIVKKWKEDRAKWEREFNYSYLKYDYYLELRDKHIINICNNTL